MRYTHVTVGGTFDHFHKGHQAMLERAFEVGKIVWLGVTSNSFLSKPHHLSAKPENEIEAYEIRKTAVETYLREKGLSGRAKIIPIDDKFGTTLADEKLEAIVVSPETELVATEINLLRAQKEYSALEVILVPWVLARDDKPIHSFRIRSGEIDREGNVYRLPKDWGIRQLPDSLREQLKQPFGKLIRDTDGNHDIAVKQFIDHSSWFIGKFNKHSKKTTNYKLRTTSSPLFISIGDAATESLLKNGVTPDISIVDLKIQRKQVFKNVAEIGFRNIKVFKTAKNEAGTVNYEAYASLLSLITSEAKPAVLEIKGEEDLMTLVALFLAPLGSLIIYGQPPHFPPSLRKRGPGGVGSGIVAVVVDEWVKEKSSSLLNLFSK